MHANRENRPSGLARAAINVTPLIDVLLVLMIIFMVVAPHRPARFEVKAPAKPRGEPPPPEILVLTVFPDSHFELNSTPIALEDVVTVLSDLMLRRSPSDRLLFVRAPAGASYESVVSVVDLVKGIGVTTIGLLAY